MISSKNKDVIQSYVGLDRYKKIRKFYIHAIDKGLKGYFCKDPDFIILGAMKCGTTSLYHYITKHTQIYPAEKKEIHFFDEKFHRGVYWYKSHFPCIAKAVHGRCITGEASPYYLYHPLAADRIHRTFPEVKLIVLLRNPIRRAISHYWHMVNTGRERLGMEKAFGAEEARLKGEKTKIIERNKYQSYEHRMFSYIDRGKYTYQLKRFDSLFQESQVLILKSEDMFNEGRSIMNEVQSFLDVEIENIKTKDVKNRGEYKTQAPRTVIHKLEKEYSEEIEKIKKERGVNFKQTALS